MKVFIITTDLVSDKRVPNDLRVQTAFESQYEGDSKFFVLGATSFDRSTVYIDVSATLKWASHELPTFIDGLLRVIDHEYGHAFFDGIPITQEEEDFMVAFEKAGEWARSQDEGLNTAEAVIE